MSLASLALGSCSILLIDRDAPEVPTLIGVLGDSVPGLGSNKFDDPEGVFVGEVGTISAIQLTTG